RQTLVVRKFGISYLELSSVPGAIGGKLSGVIQAHFDPAIANGARVILTCGQDQEKTQDQSLSQMVVWRDERIFAQAEIGIGMMGAMIPVEFEIPDGLPASKSAIASKTADIGTSIVWTIDVDADVPGLDYTAQFEVPIYKTATTCAPHPPELRRPLHPPKKPSAIITHTAGGGSEFVFPAVRDIGSATTVTAIFLVLAALMFAAWPSFLGVVI